MPASSGKNDNGDEAACEDDVQEYADQRKKCDASQKACEDDGECGINNGPTRHALNRLFPSRDGSVVSRIPCQASAMNNENPDDIRTCEIPGENREH